MLGQSSGGGGGFKFNFSGGPTTSEQPVSSGVSDVSGNDGFRFNFSEGSATADRSVCSDVLEVAGDKSVEAEEIESTAAAEKVGWVGLTIIFVCGASTSYPPSNVQRDKI
jgi:hypothetical protein